MEESYEDDDEPSTANWIQDGASQTHSIVPKRDVDWVKSSLVLESEVVIETSGPSGDTRIDLYDEGLVQLERDNNGGTSKFSRIDRACDSDSLPAGTYYVKVYENGKDDESAGYQLTLTVVQICPSALPYDLYLPIAPKNRWMRAIR